MRKILKYISGNICNFQPIEISLTIETDEKAKQMV
jgi:hypothetical protein